MTLGGSLSLLDAKYTSFPDVALPFGTSILVADPTSLAPQTDANGIVIAPAGRSASLRRATTAVWCPAPAAPASLLRPSAAT